MAGIKPRASVGRPWCRPYHFVLITASALALAGCGGDPTGVGEPEPVVGEVTLTANPSGHAPLTAEVEFTTDRAMQVELVVAGRHGPESDVVQRFEVSGPQVRLPVLGFYADFTNTITIRFLTSGGTLFGEVTRTVSTQPLIADLPEVTIDAATPGAMKPGMNLVSYFGYATDPDPQRPFVFDSFGEIRWYLDYTGDPYLADLFFAVGVERLANGNLYFGDRSSERIVEVDMLGRIIHTWLLPGYVFHHQVLEKPDGNLIVTVTKAGAATVEDHLIEIDRTSGAIIREWDLNQSLDYARRAWETSPGSHDVDWFHGNGVAYDPSDGTIIVSGRHQGTVKLTNDNQVVWILAPHRGWGTAGDGTDLSTRLLQPLDAAFQPITDPAVLDGTTNHPDFEWAWYQHAPELLPDGTLLLFDNGPNRNYTGQGPYSRAVQYQIDAQAMTIRQLWQYGKERGSETYSRIVSDVDYHSEEGNVMFTPGAAGSDSDRYGKIIEVNYDTRQVVFEATIRAPNARAGRITFHRVERLPLYPPN